LLDSTLTTAVDFLAAADRTARAAIADAENAYSATRMLIPDAAYLARRYLDFCRAAEIHPDETRVDRERARQMAEQAIRSALDRSTAQARAQASKPNRILALRSARQQVQKRPPARSQRGARDRYQPASVSRSSRSCRLRSSIICKLKCSNT